MNLRSELGSSKAGVLQNGRGLRVCRCLWSFRVLRVFGWFFGVRGGGGVEGFGVSALTPRQSRAWGLGFI